MSDIAQDNSSEEEVEVSQTMSAESFARLHNAGERRWVRREEEGP